MRISIPDDYQNCIETLDAYKLLGGHQITVIQEYISDPIELASKLNDPEALVLTRTRTAISAEFLDLFPNLKVISQTGKNAGHIDILACEDRGITVLEGRGDPTATAELTWALIMNGLRLLPQAIQGMKIGQWQTNIGRRVKGKTIGIWGFGRIGQMIAKYAAVFEAEVIIWGSKESRKKAEASGYKAAKSKEHFFSHCDVITLHLRLNDFTEGIVSYDNLITMKKMLCL